MRAVVVQVIVDDISCLPLGLKYVPGGVATRMFNCHDATAIFEDHYRILRVLGVFIRPNFIYSSMFMQKALLQMLLLAAVSVYSSALSHDAGRRSCPATQTLYY